MTAADMETQRVRERFAEVLGVGRVRRSVGLGALTTFGTGGEADWLFETSSGHEVAKAIRVCDELGLPVTLLGGGSNVLVGERGIRGVVIRLRHGDIIMPRSGVVRVDAGVTLNGLVRWTVSRGLAGLETWAGTPGTVGGGLHGNAHFRGRLLGDLLLQVGVAARNGREQQVPGAELALGYDTSRFQHTGEAVLWAEFAVSDGDVAALRMRARESLAYRKRTQPLAAPSAGCIFQNPDPVSDRLPEDVPVSAGALVERVGLKGTTVGGATVSRLHGNFIVSDGHATASDIRRLVMICRDTVQRELGVVLREEIVCLGEFASEGCERR